MLKRYNTYIMIYIELYCYTIQDILFLLFQKDYIIGFYELKY